jgi:hypothetical protein
MLDIDTKLEREIDRSYRENDAGYGYTVRQIDGYILKRNIIVY